jgi:protein transport protein SEC23
MADQNYGGSGGYQDPTPNFIEALEYRDGVRFVWNEWPLTKLDQERAVFKQACLYTPLKPLTQGTGVVQYEPVRCKNTNCQAVLNPWCPVDQVKKAWQCPICYSLNPFPPHYARNITETNLPAELLPGNYTIEYELNRVIGPPVFLFVVDTAIPDEELDKLKDSLQQSLTLLPQTALVGLLTFEANVHVHELGFHTANNNNSLPQMPQSNNNQPTVVCSKAYVFKGDKVVPPERIFHMLGVGLPGSHQQQQQPGQQQQQQQPGGATAAGKLGGGILPGLERFLAPVGDVSAALDQVIEDLCRDNWPISREYRPQRCTGVALAVAETMLEKMCPKRGARIMLFTGGPPTVGDGAVAEEKLEVPLRSHVDIEKGRATLYKNAKAFYDKLTERCVENCHAVDIFICSLDQTGLLEMKTCVEMTGGYVVLADSFDQSVFKESFRRVFTRHADSSHQADRGYLTMGLAGTLEVVVSPEVKIKGAIGPCCTLNKKGPSVSEFEVGQGGTWAWRMCAMDQTSTVAIYFDVRFFLGFLSLTLSL